MKELSLVNDLHYKDNHSTGKYGADREQGFCSTGLKSLLEIVQNEINPVIGIVILSVGRGQIQRSFCIAFFDEGFNDVIVLQTHLSDEQGR